MRHIIVDPRHDQDKIVVMAVGHNVPATYTHVNAINPAELLNLAVACVKAECVGYPSDQVVVHLDPLWSALGSKLSTFVAVQPIRPIRRTVTLDGPSTAWGTVLRNILDSRQSEVHATELPEKIVNTSMVFGPNIHRWASAALPTELPDKTVNVTVEVKVDRKTIAHAVDEALRKVTRQQ